MGTNSKENVGLWLVVDLWKILPFEDCTPMRRLLEHVEALELFGKSPNDIKRRMGPHLHIYVIIDTITVNNFTR